MELQKRTFSKSFEYKVYNYTVFILENNSGYVTASSEGIPISCMAHTIKVIKDDKTEIYEKIGVVSDKLKHEIKVAVNFTNQYFDLKTRSEEADIKQYLLEDGFLQENSN